MQPEVQSVRNGTFEASYSPSQGPYAATIEIEATSGELEIDYIELIYSFNPQDYQTLVPLGLPIPHSFLAFKDEPDILMEEGARILPFKYEGYYFKSQ